MTDKERIEELEAVVKQCGNMFHHYYELHMKKSPPDTEKAERNLEMFKLCCDVTAYPGEDECNTKSLVANTTANG